MLIINLLFGCTPITKDLIQVSEPCSVVYTLFFDDESTGWLGCGLGEGLLDIDGNKVHPSSNFYVNQILRKDDSLLVCGHDYDYDNGALLVKSSDEGQTWETMLSYGDNSDEASAYLANCNRVAFSDTKILVANDTSGDLTWSSDNGNTWAKENRYWEEANLEGGYSYYYMLELQAVGGKFFGAGSDISSPPVFFKETAQGEWYNFKAWNIDESNGEIWGLATPDEGETWFAGGNSLFKGKNDLWEQIPLEDNMNQIRDIAFDGQYGVIVGHRAPSGLGGFIMTTEDYGETWEVVDSSVPLLFSAFVVDSTYWVGGEYFLASGGI